MLNLAGLLFSVVGGFFNGCYPVPIKAASVLKADVHPIIFQCYKSFWVFVFGWVVVIARSLALRKLVFEFTWWGVASAVAWIPSGLGTIMSVPRIGVGMAMVINCGSNAALSFIAGWWLLGDKIKEYHGPGGCSFYLAPVWVVCIIIGIAALSFTPQMPLPRACYGHDSLLRGESNIQQRMGSKASVDGPVIVDRAPRRSDTLSDYCVGIVCAFLAGFFSTVQSFVVEFGRRYEERRLQCSGDVDSCPARLKEQFNDFGSWRASFGIGAIVVTGLCVLCLAGVCRLQGTHLPPFHVRVFLGPGTVTGLCWCAGSFGVTAAILIQGSAISVPTSLAVSIVTGGAFGVFLYKELKGYHAALWGAFALWTLAAMLLLSLENG